MLPAAVAVTLTAGLGAATTVAGTATDSGAQIALTGVTHAQRTMTEDFDLNGGIGADIADLLPAQFPAQDNTGETPGSTQPHTGKGVNGHLGRTVNGHRRRDFTAQTDHA